MTTLFRERGLGRHPALAANDELGNRFYTWRDESFYSVTTVINGGVPKYLHRWAAKAVAELVLEDIRSRGPYARAHAALRRWAKAGRAYVDEQKALGELVTINPAKLDDDDFMARWLKGAPDRIRDEAADRGSAVHATAEDLVLARAREAGRLLLEGQTLPAWPEQIAPWMESFLDWVRDWDPEFIAAEATVFNRSQAYAGTLDEIVRLRTGPLVDRLRRTRHGIPAWLDVDALPDPVSTMVDLKAGNDVYPTVGMQLAAYRAGEFVGSPDRLSELPVPHVDLGAVLHLTAKGPRFRLVRIDDEILRAFFYAREVFRFQIETSKTVLGDVLELIAAEVA